MLEEGRALKCSRAVAVGFGLVALLPSVAFAHGDLPQDAFEVFKRPQPEKPHMRPSYRAGDPNAFVVGADGRLPGQPDVERVAGELRRFDPETRSYVIRRPGLPPMVAHGDPPNKPDGNSSMTSAYVGANVALPTYEDQPVCTGDTGHRIVIVRSYPPAGGTTSAHSHIRKTLRRMNWKLRRQAKLSGGPDLQMKIECDGDLIKIHDVPLSSNDYFDVRNSAEHYIEGLNGGQLPNGANAIKVLVFRDDTGSGGATTWYPDVDKSSADTLDGGSNWNRVLTSIGVAWPSGVVSGNQYRWESHVPLHELFHTMGAVVPDFDPPWPTSPPYASPLTGHCLDGLDLMCYEDGSGLYTETRCPSAGGYLSPESLPIDCGTDTYFDTAPAVSSWLDTYWNLGGSENPYLTGQQQNPDFPYDDYSSGNWTGVTLPGCGELPEVAPDELPQGDPCEIEIETTELLENTDSTLLACDVVKSVYLWRDGEALVYEIEVPGTSYGSWYGYCNYGYQVIWQGGVDPQAPETWMRQQWCAYHTGDYFVPDGKAIWNRQETNYYAWPSGPPVAETFVREWTFRSNYGDPFMWSGETSATAPAYPSDWSSAIGDSGWRLTTSSNPNTIQEIEPNEEASCDWPELS